MKNKYFLQLIILFFLAIVCLPVSAAENIGADEARKWSVDKGEEIIKILASKDLAKKYSALDKIMNEDIDLENAARFTAGKYWRVMTAEQKEIYVPLFRRYLSGIYKSYPLDFKEGDLGFKVGKILPTKRGVDVQCFLDVAAIKELDSTVYKDGFPVIFSLVKEKGRIKVEDLKVGESSLLLVLRGRLHKMIYEDSDGEISWFLEDFYAIVEDTEQINAQKLENAAF